MTRTLFMVLLAIVYMACTSENGFAESKPLVFRTAVDSSYHEGSEHGRSTINQLKKRRLITTTINE